MPFNQDFAEIPTSVKQILFFYICFHHQLLAILQLPTTALSTEQERDVGAHEGPVFGQVWIHLNQNIAHTFFACEELADI